MIHAALNRTDLSTVDPAGRRQDSGLSAKIAETFSGHFSDAGKDDPIFVSGAMPTGKTPKGFTLESIAETAKDPAAANDDAKTLAQEVVYGKSLDAAARSSFGDEFMTPVCAGRPIARSSGKTANMVRLSEMLDGGKDELCRRYINTITSSLCTQWLNHTQRIKMPKLFCQPADVAPDGRSGATSPK